MFATETDTETDVITPHMLGHFFFLNIHLHKCKLKFFKKSKSFQGPKVGPGPWPIMARFALRKKIPWPNLGSPTETTHVCTDIYFLIRAFSFLKKNQCFVFVVDQVLNMCENCSYAWSDYLGITWHGQASIRTAYRYSHFMFIAGNHGNWRNKNDTSFWHISKKICSQFMWTKLWKYMKKNKVMKINWGNRRS